MKAAGVAANTQAPAGGRIENGLFVDAAMSLIESKIPAPTAAEQRRRAGQGAGADACRTASPPPPTWAPARGLGGDAPRRARPGTLKVRILTYAGGIPAMRAINGGKPSDWLYGDRLRLGGVKLYADGALGSRGAWLKQPYHDKPDTRGLQFLTDAELLDQAEQAAGSGFQLAIHAIGDAANAQVTRRDRGAGQDLSPATAAGGSSMSRSSIPPTSRASARRDHRLDAADPPDQRPADGRGAAGARRGSTAPMPGRRSRNRRAARLRLRLPGRKPQPLPRPRRRDQPPGHERPAAGRLAARRSGSASSRRSPASPAARLMPASPRTGSAASSPANGPTSSSSTATSARSIRRRSPARRCWRPGSPARRCGSEPPSARR